MPRGRIDLTSPVNWSHPVNRGLAAWWLALPQWSGGNTWFDLCRRNNGALTNGPAWRPASRPGGFGELSFDAASAQVCQSGLDPFNGAIGANNWTMACTVRVNSTAGEQAYWGLSDDNGASGNGYVWELSGGTFQVLFSGIARVNTGVAAVIGSTYRLLASDLNGTTSFYVNGVLKATSTAGQHPPTVNSRLAAGNQPGGVASRGATANIDDCAFWNRALPAAEAVANNDLGRRGYPGALRRVGRAWSSPQVLPPIDALVTDDDVALAFQTDDAPALTFSTDDDLALAGVTDDDVDLE